MHEPLMRQHFDLPYTVDTLEVNVSGFGIAYQWGQVSNPLSFCSAITSALILTCHLIGKYMYRFLKSHIYQWKRRIKKMLLRDSSSSALFFLASTKGFPRNPAANLTMIHWRKPSVGNQANKRPSTRERHWNSDSMASSPTSLCFL